MTLIPVQQLLKPDFNVNDVAYDDAADADAPIDDCADEDR
jgi:hypothetical protein